MKNYLILADGQSVHTVKWVKELKKYFNIYIVSFNAFSEILVSMVGKRNCIAFNSNINRTGGNLGVLLHLWNVVRVIDMVQPAFINAHYITSYGTVAVLSAFLCNYKGKIILSTWGSDILITPWRNKVYYYLTKCVLKRATMVTSDSKYMTEKIYKLFNDTKIITFPFGVEFFPEVHYEEKDEKMFFSNRSLEKNYNIDKVIESFSILYRADCSRKLYIANTGSEREKLINLVRKLGLDEAIRFLGFISLEEQAYFYRKCQFYFTIPTSDSTSVSLLEAMAYGCVPIASNIPANLEWLENNGDGIFIEDSKIDIKSIDCKKAFDINRNKILKRGIWHKNIKKYIQELSI